MRDSKDPDCPYRNTHDDLVEALLWCSGSQDFAPGGVAREGWLKLQPLIDQVKAQETP